MRRVVPAADLLLSPVYDVPAGLVCRAGHPLLARRPKLVPFEALLQYPIASTPLSDEVARMLVARYGPAGDPARMTTLQCEEISSLLDTVRQTDAIYLGILGAARQELARGDRHRPERQHRKPEAQPLRQPAFAERAADVIADAGNCTEAAVAAGQRDTRALEHDLLQFAFGQFSGIADVDPFLFCHAVPPVFMKFGIRITLATDFSFA